MTKQLENLINTCLKKNLNFAVFSYPNSVTFEVIIEHHLLCANTKTGFVFHPFEVSISNPEIFIAADFRISQELIDEDFIHTISLLESVEKKVSIDSNLSINKENYISNLQNGISQLQEGELEKFIYSRVKTIENTRNLDLAKYLFSLNKNHESAFVSMVNHKKSGVWLGATPETLLSWKNSTVTTMSLAGTQPILNENPVWSQKEIEEQAYVTSYIKNTFKDSKIPVNIGDSKTVKAGPVYHIKTDIESQNILSYSEALNLAKKLHPTPAICGVPVLEAKKMIASIENHNRKYYSGYLGFISPEKELQLFVNLRCMQIFSNSLALYLGGGITAKSNAEKEWEETNFKAKTLVDALP
jgi:isochorismate synthase